MRLKQLSIFLLSFLVLLSGEAFSNDEQVSEKISSVEESLQIEAELDANESEFYKDLKQIDENHVLVDNLRNEANALEGERRASLELRLIQYNLDILEQYDDITDFVVESEKNGHSVDEYRVQLSKRMLPIGPMIRRAIIRKEEALESKSQDVDPLSREGLRIFRDRQDFIDLALSALSQHVENLEDLKLNSDQSRAYLNDELERRAETLAGNIQFTKDEIVRVEKALAIDNKNHELVQTKIGLDEKFSQLIASIHATIGLYDKNALNSDPYKQIVIESTGKITADVLDPEIFKGLVTKWFRNASKYVTHNSTEFFFKLFIFIVIFFIFKLVARAVKKLVEKSIRGSSFNVSSLMREMLVSMVSRLVVILGILIGLDQVGFSLGPILAGLGVAGFIIGFALQDTLGNFASGVMILLYRPYDVGDFVDVAGVFGRVDSMNLVSTNILTIDNQTLVVPNSKIWGDVIKNVTAQTKRRIDMTFSVGLNQNADQIESILTDVVGAHDLTLDDPEPMIKLHEIKESSLEFIARPWVLTENYWPVYWDLIKSIKSRFDEEGIAIPHPQRDVHVYSHDD